MDLVTSAMITLGAIMVLGFIGNYIFNRSQIPSIVWLLIFGLIVGYIVRELGIINPANQYLLNVFSEFFAAIAIVIILFDGGINIDLYQLFKGAPRGLLLTVTNFCLTVIITMLIIFGISSLGILPISPDKSIIIGLVLGSMIGGTSSPIVIPLASKLKNLQEKTKMVTSIESILTDPICIVVVLAIFYMIKFTGGIDIALGARNLVSTFSAGIVLGIVFGLIWLFIMNKVRKEQFSYVLTLAVVFLVYSCVALIVGLDQGGTGAGAIACLMFGLVLGNGKKILRMIKYHGKGIEMDNETKQFHSLTSFVIRTFFFVYLGMIVAFQKTEFILIGILILIFLILARYITVLLSTYKGNFEKDDMQTMITMMPRGLAAAILAINFGPFFIQDFLGEETLTGFFTDVSFVIILGTAIICTIGVSYICRCEMKKINYKKE